MKKKSEKDFLAYLKELEKEKEVFFLPLKIKKAKLTHIGPIKSITLDFDRFNIIIGKNATGKTTIIRAIAYIFGHEFLEGYFSDKSTIELDVHPEKKYRIDAVSGNENIKCVLIDDGGARLDKRYFEEFLDCLKKLDMQVIITEYNLREEISYKKINVIKLPNIIENNKSGRKV
jgi:AAA15 family ATPase/GTPase